MKNSIVGVVILLFIMVFRFTDFGLQTSHSIISFLVIFAILIIGPNLAHCFMPAIGLLINSCCIFLLLFFGCHNIVMSNHSTLVLGYLLLYGYDVSGTLYYQRVWGLVIGGILVILVYYRNHKNCCYKRGLPDLVNEFRFSSHRTKWQISFTLGVATVIFFMECLHLPRAMWAGIAVASVILPFQQDSQERVKARIPGNFLGGILFLVLYPFIPSSLHSYIGILGGICVGLSASYKWQSAFNSFGAMAMAVNLIGLPGAVFFRIFHNVFGSVYGLVVHKACSKISQKLLSLKGQPVT